MIGKIDYQVSKNIKAFGRFSFWQASDVGNFGGAANYSVYDNKDRTKTVVGGVDINEGSVTHSFRAEYLKFVNVIADAVQGSTLPFAIFRMRLLSPAPDLRAVRASWRRSQRSRATVNSSMTAARSGARTSFGGEWIITGSWAGLSLVSSV